MQRNEPGQTPTPRHTLPRHERLKSRKMLESVFAHGESFLAYPIKVNFYISQLAPITPGVKIGVGASKRYFSKATDRNTIKRRMREAYRTQKSTLLHTATNNQRELHVFFSCVAKKQPTFEELQKQMAYILQRLNKYVVHFKDKNET